MKKKKIQSFCLSGGDIPEGKHITLAFKPKEVLGEKFLRMLGTEILYWEVATLEDDKVRCMVVRVDEGYSLYYGPSKMHVTLEVKEGGKPITSNDLINKVYKDYPYTPDVPEVVEDHFGDCNSGIGYISAMYYTKEGKEYSQSSKDWE